MKSKTQKEFPRKWVGIVKAKAGENVVKFTSVSTLRDAKGEENVKPFPNGETELKVKIADLPKIGKRVIRPGMGDRTFRIRFNEDGDEIEEVGPVSGLFQAKLIELGPKKKEAPALPYVRYFNKGKDNENSHLEFFAVYQIVDGVFEGLNLPAYNLHYKFEGVPEGEEDEGLTRFDTVDSPKASQLHRLQSWAEVHGGILDEPIAWNPDESSDLSNEIIDCFSKDHECEFANILPTLEERVLDADRDVSVVLEGGYIKIVQSSEDYGDFGDEDSEGNDEGEKSIYSETEEEFEKKFSDQKEKTKTPAPTSSGSKKPKHSTSDNDL